MSEAAGERDRRQPRGTAAGTRERIVTAAAEVMGTLGLARATTKEIARAAGYSEATLYKHFGDKTELFMAVLSERLPPFIELIKRLPDQAGQGEVAARLVELADALTEHGFMAEVESGPDGLRLCQHNCTVEHIAAEYPGVCVSEAELFERLLGTTVVREATIVDGAVRCVTHVATTGSSRRPAAKQAPTPLRPSTAQTPATTPVRSTA
jgi:AcrR family transcriptional regulator